MYNGIHVKYPFSLSDFS